MSFLWQHVKAVKCGNNCTVKKSVMIPMIVLAFKAATGYNAHLEERCFLTKWADPSDPWHGTGMLTRSAICSPLLPSGSVMLKIPQGNTTSAVARQTCWPAHIHRLFCSYLAECISKCKVHMMPGHRVCWSSSLYLNWQMWLMFVFPTAESFSDAWWNKDGSVISGMAFNIDTTECHHYI